MRALPATYVEGFHDLEAVKKMNYQPLGRTGMDVSKLSFGKVVRRGTWGFTVLRYWAFFHAVSR